MPPPRKVEITRGSGFTLAEVLITLGIIGVVAAITMPTLIQNHQKMVLKNQFKKAYNTLQNGYSLTELEFGYPPECYYSYDWVGAPCIEYNDSGNCIKYGESVNATNKTSDCNKLKEKFKEVFKTVKICENNALKNKCIPSYKGIDTMYKENNNTDSDYDANKATSGCGGWRQKSIETDREVWNLADGTIILWYSPMLFAVDINGMKGPNKWGYDLFVFNMYKNSNQQIGITTMSGGCSPVEKGGMNSKKMLEEIYK